MDRGEIIGQLKSQSTWRLLFLSFATLGVYLAHYIVKQTTLLNVWFEEQWRISRRLVYAILVLAYVSAALMAASLFFKPDDPVTILADLTNLIWSILILIWAFKVRNRMNALLASRQQEPAWFHGLWTFLFNAFYFNFKINQLYERRAV